MELSCSYYGVSSDLFAAHSPFVAREGFSAAVLLYCTTGKKMTVLTEVVTIAGSFTSERRITYISISSSPLKKTKDREIPSFAKSSKIKPVLIYIYIYITQYRSRKKSIMKFLYILLVALPMSLACKCVPTKCGDLPALPVCFF